MGLFNFLYRVILLLLLFFRPFKIIRTLKLFGMRPNFEVRPGAVYHLTLAQGLPYMDDSHDTHPLHPFDYPKCVVDVAFR
jgi:hypothetical protein